MGANVTSITGTPINQNTIEYTRQSLFLHGKEKYGCDDEKTFNRNFDAALIQIRKRLQLEEDVNLHSCTVIFDVEMPNIIVDAALLNFDKKATNNEDINVDCRCTLVREHGGYNCYEYRDCPKE